MAALLSAIDANATAMLNSAARITLLAAVNAEILAAATLGNFTLDYDVTGQAAPDVLYVSTQLTALKYAVTLNGDTLEISWA